MPQDFDAYHRWLGIPPEEQPADYYRLLGLVRFENDVEVIRDAAERQIAHVRRYGIGRHSELSQRILNALATAKANLLDAEDKARYDAQLRSKIAVSAARPAGDAAPEPPDLPTPVEASVASQDTTLWGGLGQWFRRVVASFAAALARRTGRTPPHAKGPEPISPKPSRPWWHLGRVSQPQPPPLPPCGVAPPLPAGPAAARGPVVPLRGRPDPQRTEEPDRADPFERLRCTAIESLKDRAVEDEPQQPHPGSQEKAAERKPEPAEHDDSQFCHPMARLPTAILWILDDGQRTGQSVRVRKFPFLIGRTQGQVRIPHDPAIDDLHLEVSWHEDDTTPQLVIRDLGSRGGLFVRAVKARVRVGQEIRIGSGCYRLSEPCVLEEVSPHSDLRLTLGQPVAWLGRIPECEPLHLSQDRMADRHHARLTQDGGDVWNIEDRDSLNGTWIRVPQVLVRSRAEILIGEQALVVDIPRHARSRT